MSEVERAALEGAVVESDRTRLPQGMVESTTEYDYAELPPWLRAGLEQWCDAFRAWDRETRGSGIPDARITKWADLFGADPNYCGGRPVDEWLDEQRGTA